MGIQVHQGLSDGKAKAVATMQRHAKLTGPLGESDSRGKQALQMVKDPEGGEKGVDKDEGGDDQSAFRQLAETLGVDEETLRRDSQFAGCLDRLATSCKKGFARLCELLSKNEEATVDTVWALDKIPEEMIHGAVSEIAPRKDQQAGAKNGSASDGAVARDAEIKRTIVSGTESADTGNCQGDKPRPFKALDDAWQRAPKGIRYAFLEVLSRDKATCGMTRAIFREIDGTGSFGLRKVRAKGKKGGRK